MERDDDRQILHDSEITEVEALELMENKVQNQEVKESDSESDDYSQLEDNYIHQEKPNRVMMAKPNSNHDPIEEIKIPEETVLDYMNSPESEGTGGEVDGTGESNDIVSESAGTEVYLSSVQMAAPEILPDIIENLDIELYNDYEEYFNKIDGREYLADVAGYLEKYAPEGLLISVGCAMSYTEGGSGKKGIYAGSNNCFGIMASSIWDGMVYSRSTGEVYKDYKTAREYGAEGLFRAYSSMEESVKDYVSLLTGDYYKEVLNYTEPAQYIKFLLDKGYGEAHLSDVWLSVINMYNLTKYDK